MNAEFIGRCVTKSTVHHLEKRLVEPRLSSLKEFDKEVGKESLAIGLTID